MEERKEYRRTTKTIQRLIQFLKFQIKSRIKITALYPAYEAEGGGVSMGCDKDFAS